MPKDDEINGATGTSYDFGARLYDPRIGRWWSIDRYANRYVPITPYAFALNNPIYFVDKDGNEIWDPIRKEAVVVTYNSSGTAMFQTTSGGQVSDEFIREAAPLLHTLSGSQVGRDLIQNMMDLNTQIELGYGGKEGGPASSLITPDQKRNGDPKLNADGLYKHVTLRPNAEKLAEDAVKNNVDFEEVLIGVMTVEIGHLSTPGQIQADQALLNDGFGFAITANDDGELKASLQRRGSLGKAAYEGLFNSAATNQIGYRAEKGQRVSSSVFMIMDGAKSKDPTTFSTVERSPATNETYKDNGGQ